MSRKSRKSAAPSSMQKSAECTTQAVVEPANRLHQMEEDVQRQLLSEPNLQFSSLVVRRLEDGICIEGVLESECDKKAISELARQVAGVDRVLNHLLQHRPLCKNH